MTSGTITAAMMSGGGMIETDDGQTIPFQMTCLAHDLTTIHWGPSLVGCRCEFEVVNLGSLGRLATKVRIEGKDTTASQKPAA